MQSLERRIAALEVRASDDGLNVVAVLPGESEREALHRVGLPPGARVVFCAGLDLEL